MAKMANGHADDLASTALLATDKPVLVAPAMNPMMWGHAATRRNVARLRADGVSFVGPDAGDMACGETGSGRMAEPLVILDAILALLGEAPAAPPIPGPLSGRRALVTSGPTHEAIDPVRYIANRSSGRQGHAIAQALAEAGAEVTLVSGPVSLPDPPGVAVCRVESARDMLAEVEAALPVDIAVCAAAVADWRPTAARAGKLKKTGGQGPAALELTTNPDILQTLSCHATLRPRLVVGFAAETDDLIANAQAKLERKGCDWILANDVGAGSGVFGGERNRVHLVRKAAAPEAWPEATKHEVAMRLVARLAEALRP
jgi:phosphopantothenoylcysteine decarboxylase/phosphopantothenate--cysteine ligase